MSRSQCHARRRRCALPGAVSRRRFVEAAAAIGLPLGASAALLRPASAQALTSAGPANLEGFASSCSVAPGGQIDFRVRNPDARSPAGEQVPITITRMGSPDRDMLSAVVAVGNPPVPADASSNGCMSWPVSYRLRVPSTWPSGLYWATFGGGSSACTVPFVVGAARNNRAKVLVQIPVTTAQAYNPYGGKSLYEYNSSGGVRGTAVSFNRPHVDPWNYAFDRWQPSFVRWLEQQGIVADYCTSIDLHQNSALLGAYRLFTFAGHDEYWSRTMRDRLDAFVAAGGNVAIFSGNTCFWQVRFEAAGGSDRRMVCYKSRTADPRGTPATKTTYWADLAPPYPENSSIGLSFLNGASWTSELPRPLAPYVVQQAGHWVFQGTGLMRGAGFGAEVVGYETDAADFRTGVDGRFYPSGNDATPATLQILAQADCSDWDARAQALGLSGERSGYAAMAVFSRGGGAGTVFNAGSTDWVLGLQPELDGQTPGTIGLITRNVLRVLAAARTESAEVRQWHGGTGASSGNWYDTIGTEQPAGMALVGAVYRALAGPASGAVPVYRFNGRVVGASGPRHALSRALSIGTADWSRSGVAFYAFAAPGMGLEPVYQWRATDASGLPLLRYSRASQPEAGWALDGVAFYAPMG